MYRLYRTSLGCFVEAAFGGGATLFPQHKQVSDTFTVDLQHRHLDVRVAIAAIRLITTVVPCSRVPVFPCSRVKQRPLERPRTVFQL